MTRVKQLLFISVAFTFLFISSQCLAHTRHIYQGVFQYITGRVVPGGTVTVYLAGTTTPATIYDQESGGSAVSGSVLTSSNKGHYYFYVDELDYAATQRFKTVLSKSGYTSQTYDNIRILPGQSGRVYYPDATVADQGAATTEGNRSIKDLVDTIGATKKATIKLIPSGSGNTTTYTVSTDETIPSNIRLKIENGAILSIDNTKTLTINSPFKVGLYQVINGDGNVSFGNGAVIEVYSEWWGGKADATTDSTTAFQAALDSFPKVILSEGTYNIDQIITTQTNHIVGRGVTETVIAPQTSAGEVCLKIDNSESSISDLTIERPEGYGADIGTDIQTNTSGVQIKNVKCKYSEYGLDGASNFYYMNLENVDFENCAVLIDSTANNNNTFTKCRFDKLSMTGGVNVDFISCDMSAQSSVAGDKPYRFTDFYNLAFFGLYSEGIGSEGNSYTMFEFKRSSLASSIFMEVLIDNPYLRANGTDYDGAYILLDDVICNIRGGWINGMDYIVALSNGADCSFYNVGKKSGGPDFCESESSFRGIINDHYSIRLSTKSPNPVADNVGGLAISPSFMALSATAATLSNANYRSNRQASVINARHHEFRSAGNLAGAIDVYSDDIVRLGATNDVRLVADLDSGSEHAVVWSQTKWASQEDSIQSLGDSSHRWKQAYVNKFMQLSSQTSAPTGAAVGAIAIADRANWDPASIGSGGAYVVWYNGSNWVQINSQ